jgi:hypothetical protein
MPPTPTTIRCPNCRSPIQASIEQLLDVGRDPGAKARLLSGSMNRVRCPVCGFDGQVGSPLVYHDPDKGLLLTYIPVELGLPQSEQERVIGALINQAIQGLPAERRKAYLFQPQPTLTLPSLVERVLSADGITREELESQRGRLRLLEDLLRTEPDRIQAFVAEHDGQLDEPFFQLATLALEGTPEGEAREAALARLDAALGVSSMGKRLKARQDEVRAAVDSLRQAGEGLTRERLLALFLEAPNPDRMDALASLTRPALDYAFFQILSERIDAAKGEVKTRLTDLRTRLLEVTQKIDQVQQARLEQSAAVLQSLLEAQDLDQALGQVSPMIDDLFLGLLRGNLKAARDRGDVRTSERLEEIDRRIQALIRESLPPGMRLAQQLLETPEEAEAEKLLDSSAEAIDEDLLGALLGTVDRLEQSGDPASAERLRRLYRRALRISMKNKLAKAGPS